MEFKDVKLAVVVVWVVPEPLTIKNHSVSLPPAVQVISAEVAVILLAVRPKGAIQLTHAFTSTKSIAKSPW